MGFRIKIFKKQFVCILFSVCSFITLVENMIANGQAKIVFEVTTLRNRFSFNTVHAIDFVLVGGTNSVLVIWGLIVCSVFCQILSRKTVNAFCTASFTSRYKFSYRALARQSRLSVIPYQEVHFDWLPKKPEHCDKVIHFGVI